MIIGARLPRHDTLMIENALAGQARRCAVCERVFAIARAWGGTRKTGEDGKDGGGGVPASPEACILDASRKSVRVMPEARGHACVSRTKVNSG